MPYTSRGKCVYKKDTGKKVGCTKGPVKDYLAALHANVHKEKNKAISFKEYFAKVTAANGSQQYADTTVTAEGEYAQGQDNVAQPGGYDNIGFKNNSPTFTVEKSEKDKTIDICIDFLEKLNKKGIPIDNDEMDKLLGQLQKMADKLFSVGIEPVDIVATIKNPRMAMQYLIKGPSAPGGGGKGALQDLKDIKAGLLTDDESNPGGADTTADIENIDYNNFIIKPFLNDPNNGKDQPEGALENFKDGKNPGRKGLSRRVGIPKKPSLSTLSKIAKNSTGERRRMAQWQLNMRRGKKKK